MAMKKRYKIKYISINKLILLLLIVIVEGCVGVSTQVKFPEPGQTFISSSEKSMMIGQFEVLSDGYPIPLNPSSLAIFPMSSYLENEVAFSELIFIDIDPNTGYFVAALSPGKYVIHKITYRVDVPSLKNFRTTYRKVCAGCNYEMGIDKGILRTPSPILPIFDVFPGKATYVGTLQAVTDSYLNIDRWEVKSKYERSKEVFSTLYPAHTEPIENLMKIKPCQVDMTNKIFSYDKLCLPVEDK